MLYNAGPRGLRVYEALRHRILSGELPLGAQLPAYTALAAEFDVAPLTVRQAIARLEQEGLIWREHGRGTFVRARAPRAVLIVDDEAPVRVLLRTHVERAGYRAVEAAGPAEGLAALERDQAIALVLSDIRMPDAEMGVAFIQGVRRRWPSLPLAAVTGYPQDLKALHGTPEWPLLVVTKPFHAQQIEEALRLALSAPVQPREAPRLPVLLADRDANARSYLRDLVTDAGYEVAEATNDEEVREARRRRRFGHVFLDLDLPGGGLETAIALGSTTPATTVILTTSYPHLDLRAFDGPVTVLPKPFSADQVQTALRLRVARSEAEQAAE